MAHSLEGKNCWKSAGKQADELCWCNTASECCRSGWTFGTEASSRESLSADLELLHLLLPPAIIHSRRTPHEADDGCLACGPSTLAVLRRGSCRKMGNVLSLMTLLLLNMTEDVNPKLDDKSTNDLKPCWRMKIPFLLYCPYCVQLILYLKKKTKKGNQPFTLLLSIISTLKVCSRDHIWLFFYFAWTFLYVKN